MLVPFIIKRNMDEEFFDNERYKYNHHNQPEHTTVKKPVWQTKNIRILTRVFTPQSIGKSKPPNNIEDDYSNPDECFTISNFKSLIFFMFLLHLSNSYPECSQKCITINNTLCAKRK